MPHLQQINERKVFVSNYGFGPPPVGLGQIVKITVPPVSN
jgi:hypothetical protein